MPSLNIVTGIFILVFFGELVARLGLEKLNRKWVRANNLHVPRFFSDYIDQQKLDQITGYTIRKSVLGDVHKVVADTMLMVIIMGGFLCRMVSSIEGWRLGEIQAGLLFYFAVGGLFVLVDLPFDWYRTFVIEESYGFNLGNKRTWWLDQLKGILVVTFIVVILVSTVLKLIQWSPRNWWLWAVAFLFLFQLILSLVYPVVIAPLFNRFEPINDPELAEHLDRLATRAGFHLKGVFQMDASRRNRHTNAYFTGIGKTKRVVLFDTLLTSHSRDEILAIVAHELAHHKMKHIPKQLLLMLSLLFIGFYVADQMLSHPQNYTAFGFVSPHAYVGLFLAGIFIHKIAFFIKPIYMAMLRRFELEADSYAARLLNTGYPLVVALKRLAADNLANLAPHPLYVRFHYSHPPLVERVEKLVTRTDSASV